MRCLLVEDNQVLGDALRDHLTALGLKADWRLTLGDATVAIQAEEFDLVLLDLNLPDGNGLSLLRRLRSTEDETPVIVLTAYDQMSDRMNAINFGATDFLVKPFDLSTLTSAIRSIGFTANSQIRCAASERDRFAHAPFSPMKAAEMQNRQYGACRALLEHLKRFEPATLMLFGIFAGGIFLFQHLVGEVIEGEPLKFDATILLALRQQDNPAVPVDPAWLLHAADDITSLGGVTVLSLLTVMVTVYFIVSNKRALALFIALSVSGGWLISTLLKIGVGRPRPDIVPHLAHVSDLSFPSGHAMLSTVTYLTLGALLAKGRVFSERIYLIGCAIFLTVSIGFSRVYLGVHFPSDVLGGWCAGTIWALLCRLIFDRLSNSQVGRQRLEATPQDQCRKADREQ